MGDSDGELAARLLELVGDAAKVLALLAETTEEEFTVNAPRLQMFFDLVEQMPTSAVYKEPPARPVGFQAPALPRKGQKKKRH